VYYEKIVHQVGYVPEITVNIVVASGVTEGNERQRWLPFVANA
jgi:hypothetical protein